MRRFWVLLGLLGLSGCMGMPEGVTPVKPFELERYLGTWYEVARLDHSFERGLSRVTAEYRRLPDGGVRVVNRGFDKEKGEWKEAEGKAYFVEGEDQGYLKVSFFGPFYSSYVVFGLDEGYETAFVAGFSRDYLWLLARQPEVGEEVKARFLERAEALGFDVAQLIWL